MQPIQLSLLDDLPTTAVRQRTPATEREKRHATAAACHKKHIADHDAVRTAIEAFFTNDFVRNTKRFAFFEFTAAYEQAAVRHGWPIVAESRAYGPLPQIWKRRGWIRDTGLFKTRPNGNATAVYEII